MVGFALLIGVLEYLRFCLDVFYSLFNIEFGFIEILLYKNWPYHLENICILF